MLISRRFSCFSEDYMVHLLRELLIDLDMSAHVSIKNFSYFAKSRFDNLERKYKGSV